MSAEPETSRKDRMQARHLRMGLAASVLLHILVFALLTGDRLPPLPFAAAGERAGDFRAAQGGGMEAVELRPPTPQAVPTPPPAVPVPDPLVEREQPPEPELDVEDVPVITLAEAFLAAGTPGPARGPGLAVGDGRGDGGTEAEGRFRVVPPRPRGLILPPADRPESVKGREIEVWVYVSSTGEVVSDSTRLRPSTGDRRFDRRLREQAAGWVFEAAKREGKAVAEWFRYTIVM